MVYSYNASNIAGHTKKVTINAMTLFTFSLGNIVGTEVFLPKDAPSYVPGKVAILVLWTAQLFFTILLRAINLRMNKNKLLNLQRMKTQNGWSDQDMERERERHAFLDLTDKQFVLIIPWPRPLAEYSTETLSLSTCRNYNLSCQQYSDRPVSKRTALPTTANQVSSQIVRTEDRSENSH
jgi:hypothetical protein